MCVVVNSDLQRGSSWGEEDGDTSTGLLLCWYGNHRLRERERERERDTVRSYIKRSENVWASIALNRISKCTSIIRFGPQSVSFIERLSSLQKLKRTTIIDKGPQSVSFIERFSLLHPLFKVSIIRGFAISKLATHTHTHLPNILRALRQRKKKKGFILEHFCSHSCSFTKSSPSC